MSITFTYRQADLDLFSMTATSNSGGWRERGEACMQMVQAGANPFVLIDRATATSLRQIPKFLDDAETITAAAFSAEGGEFPVAGGVDLIAKNLFQPVFTKTFNLGPCNYLELLGIHGQNDCIDKILPLARQASMLSHGEFNLALGRASNAIMVDGCERLGRVRRGLPINWPTSNAVAKLFAHGALVDPTFWNEKGHDFGDGKKSIHILDAITYLLDDAQGANALQALSDSGFVIIGPQNYRRHSPLHVAVEANRPLTALKLLEHGADPMRKNGKGHTAIDCAKWRPEVLQTIQAYQALSVMKKTLGTLTTQSANTLRPS